MRRRLTETWLWIWVGIEYSVSREIGGNVIETWVLELVKSKAPCIPWVGERLQKLECILNVEKCYICFHFKLLRWSKILIDLSEKWRYSHLNGNAFSLLYHKMSWDALVLNVNSCHFTFCSRDYFHALRSQRVNMNKKRKKSAKP